MCRCSTVYIYILRRLWPVLSATRPSFFVLHDQINCWVLKTKEKISVLTRNDACVALDVKASYFSERAASNQNNTGEFTSRCSSQFSASHSWTAFMRFHIKLYQREREIYLYNKVSYFCKHVCCDHLHPDTWSSLHLHSLCLCERRVVSDLQ